MHENLLLILGLLFGVMLLVMLAQKIRVAYPIFLVLAGLAVGFIPGMPVLKLDPELIFLIFLPPLLYEAAWYTSWKDFKKWKTPIALLAFGLVFLTSIVVAYTAQLFIPGFTLALGFLLGGIISPPDAIAATTVLKGLKVPRRTITILEGESLVNDASSLIVFRFALAAILTATFSMQQAVGQFFLVAGMGVVVGLVGAHIMYFIHRFLPTTAAIDAALTVMTPYILFLCAEHFHYSGVMAVVSGGLFMSFRAHEVFKTGSTRMNMTAVWHTLIFVMNALVFILIGLDLPEIVQGLGDVSIDQAIKYGVIISLITIVLRISWTYCIAHIPRLVSKTVRNIPSPGWKNPLITGWAGMRGVVSLATALSIPLLMNDGSAFPHRDLIIFITFVVIFVTLVFQGLTLPFIIKLTNIGEIDPVLPEHEQHAGIQLKLDAVALQHLQTKHASAGENNSLLRAFTEKLKNDIEGHHIYLNSVEVCTNKAVERKEFRQVMSDVHDKQRKELFKMRKEQTYTDEAIRKAEHLLDINDLKLSDSEY
ncbi:Na+/H+ antiporter [Mucilaginibacter sp. JRF]|uniref:Na+/H+ antiporter n=1 Tax=Mucilaginibacter sp. JRF TaxID=2780088 RepID=UPI001881B3C5|nr:Na+/H+ antiporter [Mucilaginibacter sp. JRF]MBE9586206.1 Na+/H+ antiporter [Mucilaginibacter sp. JRF]